MQAFGSYQKVMGCLILLGLGIIGCQKKQDVFEAAIAKHRNTLVDQVNIPGPGLPYFTVETLNPVWQLSARTPIVSVPQFRLVDQDGRLRDHSLFESRITVIGFIFASCSGFCPFLVEGMKSVEREVRSLSDKVQFVAFSVNPEEDTPDRLKAYAQERGLNTDKNWVLLTGDRDTIYSLAKKTFASQVFRRKTSASSFVHSEHLYVIDSNKNLRGILNGTRIDIKKDARIMLTQLAGVKERPTN